MPTPTILGHGLSLTSLPNYDLHALDALLALYAEIGCTHLEVSAWRLDMIVGGRIIERRAEEVASILSRHDLGLVLHANHGINFMDIPNYKMHQKVAKANINLARRMGVKSVVIHSGWVPTDVWLISRDKLLTAEQEALKWLSDLAAEADTRLAVENLFADPSCKKVYYGSDPRALADQIATVNHPALGACLDFGHAFISSKVRNFDFISAIAELSEQTWNSH
ncbi:MAG: hypothetical protein D3915_04925 [Candidatus Electrothrix sp. AU1_5]|nr:hypothetical protein [Candidatus Electrothrix gigas]